MFLLKEKHYIRLPKCILLFKLLFNFSSDLPSSESSVAVCGFIPPYATVHEWNTTVCVIINDFINIYYVEIVIMLLCKVIMRYKYLITTLFS